MANRRANSVASFHCPLQFHPNFFVKLFSMSPTAPPTDSQSVFVNKFVAWLKNPVEVASICPSSKVLTRFIAKRPIIAEADVVVDLGPANGETSRELLRHMPPQSTLLAIEKNELLAQSLKQIRDKRFLAFNDDASNLSHLLRENQIGRPKVIVSGIPFSTLEPNTARRIVESISKLLQPGGQFIAYQCRDTVATYASKHFAEPEVRWIWRNIPPLRVFVWTKQSRTKNLPTSSQQASSKVFNS